MTRSAKKKYYGIYAYLRVFYSVIVRVEQLWFKPLDSKYEVGTLTVDGWAVTFGTARRGLGGAAARPGPSSLYQM